jgi:capsular polysaccharide transport system permease protein
MSGVHHSRRRSARHAVPLWTFVAFVLVPTLLTVAYFAFVAAEVYVSEARFLVRGRSGPAAISLESMLSGGLGGGFTPATTESFSVHDYIRSRDAIRALDEKVDLRAIYRRPEADWLARLSDDATLEDFLDYYRDRVSVTLDTSSGITTLRVVAFRPEDAQGVAHALLTESETLVNRFSEKAERDTLQLARDEVRRAEERIARAREDLTAFREKAKAIDPGQSSAAVMQIISGLDGELAKVRAEMVESLTFMKPDNPRMVSLRAREEALQSQIERENAKLTGADGALAPVVAEYERFLVEKEFADREYTSALASLEQARIDAQRQQLYLIQVVAPHVADEADQRALRIVLTVFVGLILAYGIMSLVVAGVREHLS